MAFTVKFRLSAAVRTVAVAGIVLTAGLEPGAAAAQQFGGPDGKLVFGYRTDAPPFSFEVEGSVAGVSGFTAELCHLVTRELASAPETSGLSRGVVRVSAEDRFKRVANGEIDVLCGAASITEARRKVVAFSIPVLQTGIAVAVMGDAPARLGELAGASDLAGALVAAAGAEATRIGYRDGTTTGDWLAASPLASASTATLTAFPDHRAGIAALNAGEVDVYMADKAILKGLTRNAETDVRVSSTTVQTEEIALAMALEADDLRGVIDRLLARLYGSGEIEAIFERNFGPMGDADRAFYQRHAGN